MNLFNTQCDFEYFLEKGLGKYDNFFEYLNNNWPNFIFEILACPYCLGFWITVASAWIFDYDFKYIFVSYFIVFNFWKHFFENEQRIRKNNT